MVSYKLLPQVLIPEATIYRITVSSVLFTEQIKIFWTYVSSCPHTYISVTKS